MSPIVGVTHQQPEFPQIGQLRKGAEKPKGGIGKDLTYFRFTTDIPEVAEAFAASYNSEPRLVNVFLPFRTTDENWEAWREEYRAGGLVHRCDGETQVLWQKKDGSYSREPRPCPEMTKDKPACKPTGRLKVIIPELRRLAYAMVLTTSWHDIKNLDSQLRALESLHNDLRGIPLQLRRRPDRISTPGKGGKRMRREKWLLSIEAAPQYVELQLQAAEEAARPMLPEPTPQGGIVVDGATGEVVGDQGNGPDYDAAPEEWFGDPPPEAAQQEPPSEPAPEKAANGNGKLERPIPADALRTNLRKRAGWQNGSRLVEGEPITEKQVGFVAALMGKALPNLGNDIRDKVRHQILDYLWTVDSTNNLMKREASATIDWLAEPGTHDVNRYAIAEVEGILKELAIEAGQQALPLEEPESSELDQHFSQNATGSGESVAESAPVAEQEAMPF